MAPRHLPTLKFAFLNWNILGIGTTPHLSDCDTGGGEVGRGGAEDDETFAGVRAGVGAI